MRHAVDPQPLFDVRAWQQTCAGHFVFQLAEVVTQLKSQPGADMLIMGSGSLVQQLTNAGRIDEYRLIVTPVIAGSGKSFFKNVKQTSLTLLSAQCFKSGNVILRYAASR